MFDYRYEDIKRAYKNLGVAEGKVIFVQSDLACLGVFESPDKKWR